MRKVHKQVQEKWSGIIWVSALCGYAGRAADMITTGYNKKVTCKRCLKIMEKTE